MSGAKWRHLKRDLEFTVRMSLNEYKCYLYQTFTIFCNTTKIGDCLGAKTLWLLIDIVLSWTCVLGGAGLNAFVSRAWGSGLLSGSWLCGWLLDRDFCLGAERRKTPKPQAIKMTLPSTARKARISIFFITPGGQRWNKLFLMKQY